MLNEIFWNLAGVDATDTGECYDFAMNAWLSISTMPTACYAPAGVEYQNRIYISGGSERFDDLNVLQRYDPGTHSWETLAPMQGESFYASELSSIISLYFNDQKLPIALRLM